MESLEGATATRRHIILLTDGWSSSGQYDAILERMKAAGITLSTVGAGGGSNPFLEGLAQQGGGRFYDAANPASIPDIFLKETQQVSGQQIVEEPFFPILTSSSPILRGLDEGLPRLRGYNGTTAKPAAQTVLVTARDDPLLAQWQYGLGRSVAWTSDSTGRWARDWLGWDGFSRFFSQLVSWTFPGEETGGIEAVFDSARRQDHAPRRVRRDRRLAARLLRDDARSSSGRTSSRRTSRSCRSPRASTRRPSARSTRAPTPSGSPRRGRARRRSVARSGSSPRPPPSTGCSARTSRSWRRSARRPAAASSRRRSTRGATTCITTSRSTDLWPLLLVLALLLWPLDIALRRVSVGRREFAAAGAWVRGHPAAPPRGRPRARPRARACSRHASGPRRRASGRRSRVRTTVTAAARLPRRPSRTGRRRLPIRLAAATVASSDAAPAASAAPAGAAPPPRPRRQPAPAPARRAASRAPRRRRPRPQPADTMARLREAKRRARER